MLSRSVVIFSDFGFRLFEHLSCFSSFIVFYLSSSESTRVDRFLLFVLFFVLLFGGFQMLNSHQLRLVLMISRSGRHILCRQLSVTDQAFWLLVPVFVFFGPTSSLSLRLLNSFISSVVFGLYLFF